MEGNQGDSNNSFWIHETTHAVIITKYTRHKTSWLRTRLFVSLWRNYWILYTSLDTQILHQVICMIIFSLSPNIHDIRHPDFAPGCLFDCDVIITWYTQHKTPRFSLRLFVCLWRNYWIIYMWQDTQILFIDRQYKTLSQLYIEVCFEVIC